MINQFSEYFAHCCELLVANDWAEPTTAKYPPYPLYKHKQLATKDFPWLEDMHYAWRQWRPSDSIWGNDDVEYHKGDTFETESYGEQLIGVAEYFKLSNGGSVPLVKFLYNLELFELSECHKI
jgi:hypothetical protein